MRRNEKEKGRGLPPLLNQHRRLSPTPSPPTTILSPVDAEGFCHPDDSCFCPDDDDRHEASPLPRELQRRGSRSPPTTLSGGVFTRERDGGRSGLSATSGLGNRSPSSPSVLLPSRRVSSSGSLSPTNGNNNDHGGVISTGRCTCPVSARCRSSVYHPRRPLVKGPLYVRYGDRWTLCHVELSNSRLKVEVTAGLLLEWSERKQQEGKQQRRHHEDEGHVKRPREGGKCLQEGERELASPGTLLLLPNSVGISSPRLERRAGGRGSLTGLGAGGTSQELYHILSGREEGGGVPRGTSSGPMEEIRLVTPKSGTPSPTAGLFLQKSCGRTSSPSNMSPHSSNTCNNYSSSSQAVCNCEGESIPIERHPLCRSVEVDRIQEIKLLHFLHYFDNFIFEIILKKNTTGGSSRRLKDKIADLKMPAHFGKSVNENIGDCHGEQFEVLSFKCPDEKTLFEWVDGLEDATDPIDALIRNIAQPAPSGWRYEVPVYGQVPHPFPTTTFPTTAAAAASSSSGRMGENGSEQGGGAPLVERAKSQGGSAMCIDGSISGLSSTTLHPSPVSLQPLIPTAPLKPAAATWLE